MLEEKVIEKLIKLIESIGFEEGLNWIGVPTQYYKKKEYSIALSINNATSEVYLRLFHDFYEKDDVLLFKENLVALYNTFESFRKDNEAFYEYIESQIRKYTDSVFYTKDEIIKAYEEQLKNHDKNFGELTVGDLLYQIIWRKIPLNAPVYYERIEDKYFIDDIGWKDKLKFVDGDYSELNYKHQFIPAFCAYNNPTDENKSLLITAHY